MVGFRYGAILTKNVGTVHRQKSLGQSSLVGRGKRKAGRNTRQLTASRWRKMIEQKAFRGMLVVAFGMEQLVQRMSPSKKRWTRSVLVDVE